MKSLQSNLTLSDSGFRDIIPFQMLQLVQMFTQTVRNPVVVRFLAHISSYYKKHSFFTSGLKTPRLVSTLKLINGVPVGNRLILVFLISVRVAWSRYVCISSAPLCLVECGEVCISGVFCLMACHIKYLEYISILQIKVSKTAFSFQ